MIASDGYEYETLADRLLGRPTKNERNRYFKVLHVDHTPEEARHYIETYDTYASDSKSVEFAAALDRAWDVNAC